jgi:hypothetical protein
MFNPFTMKKYAALILSGMLCTICFYIGVSIYSSLLLAMGLLAVGLLVSIVVGILLLNNPFTLMMEGKGILALDLNSTGVIRPFIVKVTTPFIAAKYNGKMIHDVFDRDTVMQLAAPIKARMQLEKKDNGNIVIQLDEAELLKLKQKTKEGFTTLELTEEQYNAGRFALFHYPCIIWNSQVGSILTKDFLSEAEKTTFAEHTIIYLNRKMEELTSIVRDFGRYVVELTKPQGSGMGNKWIWIIVAVGVVILGIIFLPSIISTIKGAGGTASAAISTAGGAVQGATITPVA